MSLYLIFHKNLAHSIQSNQEVIDLNILDKLLTLSINLLDESWKNYESYNINYVTKNENVTKKSKKRDFDYRENFMWLHVIYYIEDKCVFVNWLSRKAMDWGGAQNIFGWFEEAGERGLERDFKELCDHKDPNPSSKPCPEVLFEEDECKW